MKKLCLVFSACAALAFSSTVNAQNVGQIVQGYDSRAYEVLEKTTGIITNGSFNEAPGENKVVPGWFSNSSTAEVPMTTTYFDVMPTGGAVDNGAYLKAKSNAGSASVSSIRTGWKLEAGKSYVVSLWSKKAGDWSDIFLSANAHSTSITLKAIPHTDVWTQTMVGFTATEEKPYLVLICGWLGSIACFDEVSLWTAKEVANTDLLLQTIADAKALDEVVQTRIQTQIDEARTYVSSTDIELVRNAILDLKNTISGYSTLNNSLKSFREKLAVAETLGVDVEKYNQKLLDNASAITATELNGAWSNDLNVDEFYAVKYTYPNEVELGEWTNNNVQTRNTDHWSGAVINYYNVWNNKSDSGNLTQNIDLPAGDYVLMVAVRGSNGEAVVALNFDDKSDVSLGRGLTGVGIDQSGNANFSADGAYANSGKGFGWQYRYIPLSLPAPKNVKISVGMSITTNQRANVGEITLLGRFYSRKVASGDYGTICLPYDVDMASVSGVEKVYTVSNMTSELATLTPVEAMEAGKPYIFKASADEVVIPAKVGGAVVGTPQEDTYLVGTFADIDKMDYGTYVLSGNKFCKVVEGNEGDAVTLGAYRCYFKPLANGIKNFGFVEDDGETTGIDNVENGTYMKNAVIYDLTGRRVTSPVKGIYIVNGKKMVIDNLK